MSNYLVTDISENEWADVINCLPDIHFLQSIEWAHIKSRLGWTSFYKIWHDQTGDIVAGTLILEREIGFLNLPIKSRIHYLPKGPLLDWSNLDLVEKVISDIEEFSKNRRVIFTKIDPDIIFAEGVSGDLDYVENQKAIELQKKLINRNWKFSENQIQFQNTVLINIELNEEEILSRMKQKTRYNIRLAERKGIKIRIASKNEFPLLYRMYAQTAIRDNFTIRSEKYYLDLWQEFSEKDFCVGLIAEFENFPIAGLMLYFYGERAYYVYGMSLDKHRNLMPTYLLQWEAIRLAKTKGKKIYDLWGAPYVFDESDSMWGVYIFKKGLGGKVIQTLGAWDFPTNRLMYYIYLKVVPRILNIFRVFGKKATERSID